MKRFEVDEHKRITSFHYHDLVFKRLEIVGDKLNLTIGSDHETVDVLLTGVNYLEVGEMIPNGIVLTCYTFSLTEIPQHLKSEISFSRSEPFLGETDPQVFYVDGTMGFELMVIYKEGWSGYGEIGSTQTN